MKHKRIALWVTVLTTMLTAASAQREAGEPDFDLSWHTIDGGGATFSTGGGFQLGGTIGQFDASSTVMTGDGFQLTGGFWAATTPGFVPCLGDMAPPPVGDGSVDVDDLLAIISAWGACADPDNCPADIAPPGGDDLVNVDDLLVVIGAWGPCR